MEKKRRGIRVVTLRIRHKMGLQKVGHTHTNMASVQYRHSGVDMSSNKLIRLSGYPRPYPMVVRTLKVSRWPPRGGLDSDFPTPRTPIHHSQGFTPSGSYARQFGPWLLIGYSQLTCTFAFTCTHTYIYMHTHKQIHRPSSYLPPAEAPHCRGGASYLLRP